MQRHIEIIGRKVIIPRRLVPQFNAQWPCSTLRPNRAYWFEFDASGDLIDTDCPEQDDGPAASAMAEDCKALLFDEDYADWMMD